MTIFDRAIKTDGFGVAASEGSRPRPDRPALPQRSPQTVASSTNTEKNDARGFREPHWGVRAWFRSREPDSVPRGGGGSTFSVGPGCRAGLHPIGNAGRSRGRPAVVPFRVELFSEMLECGSALEIPIDITGGRQNVQLHRKRRIRTTVEDGV